LIAWLKLNETRTRRAYSRGERSAATIHSWVLLRNQDMRILLLLTGCALATFHPSGAPAQSSSKLEELQKQLEASQKELEEANARILDLIRKPLSDFTNENPPRCESENLRKSVANALNVVETVESRKFKFDPKEQLDLGSTIVDVADAARKAGCNREAHAVYDYVIGVFVGSGYAALRQRAERGIQDLSKR
jgi:hypothetical protein